MNKNFEHMFHSIFSNSVSCALFFFSGNLTVKTLDRLSCYVFAAGDPSRRCLKERNLETDLMRS